MFIIMTGVIHYKEKYIECAGRENVEIKLQNKNSFKQNSKK